MLATCSGRDGRTAAWVALAVVLVAVPAWQAHRAREALARRIALVPIQPRGCAGELPVAPALQAGRTLLASWQSVGGCGASAATGGGPGVKWIGPIVTGGLFNVLCLASYTPMLSDPAKIEHQLFVNTLITQDVGEKWQLGVNLPLVYKYLRDPHGLNVDLSNSGLGDISVQATRRLGAINNTLLTASLGLPTGKPDQQYKMAYLRQHQQLGFGKLTGALSVDHVKDELWGMFVLGGSAAWRGGENNLSNYRAPSASLYAFTGYFVGRVVPSIGLSLTGFSEHDRDRGQEEDSGLFLAAPTVAVNWGNDWIGMIAGASFPYQYDGRFETHEGRPRSPWGWGAWNLSVGVMMAPF